jgi:C-terminal processing protease CtpA/Prc
LFDILQFMIAPFHDAHTSISAPDLKRNFHVYREGTERITKGSPADFRKKIMPELLAVTERAYLDTPLRQYCNGRVFYGHVKDSGIGYLRILAFAGYAQQGGYAAGSEALESALDEIFSDPKLKALVIDVRINFGGADPWGLAIASRLATHDYLAYTKVARTNPPESTRWTPPEPSTVRPSSRPGFHGPVVELTSAMTISAGETFTQALMGRTPHILRIGENTQGVFSDVLGRKLPNGWEFGLPNEIYRDEKGKTFDIVGIPPEVAVPVFADADVSAGKDPAMGKALEILNRK